jgi:hypothetical protein
MSCTVSTSSKYDELNPKPYVFVGVIAGDYVLLNDLHSAASAQKYTMVTAE